MEQGAMDKQWEEIVSMGITTEDDALFLIQHFVEILQSIHNVDDPGIAYESLMKAVSGINMAIESTLQRWPSLHAEIGRRLSEWINLVRETTAEVARVLRQSLGQNVVGYSVGIVFPLGLTLSINFSIDPYPSLLEHTEDKLLEFSAIGS